MWVNFFFLRLCGTHILLIFILGALAFIKEDQKKPIQLIWSIAAAPLFTLCLTECSVIPPVPPENPSLL